MVEGPRWTGWKAGELVESKTWTIDDGGGEKASRDSRLDLVTRSKSPRRCGPDGAASCRVESMRAARLQGVPRLRASLSVSHTSTHGGTIRGGAKTGRATVHGPIDTTCHIRVHLPLQIPSSLAVPETRYLLPIPSLNRCVLRYADDPPPSLSLPLSVCLWSTTSFAIAMRIFRFRVRPISAALLNAGSSL